MSELQVQHIVAKIELADEPLQHLVDSIVFQPKRFLLQPLIFEHFELCANKFLGFDLELTG